MDLLLQLSHRPTRGPAIESDLRVSTKRLGLSGPSGIGKTTLLRIVAGVERTTGRIEVNGEAWLDTNSGVFVAPQARRVGWVPQDSLLFPHLAVEDNLRFGLNRSRGGPGLDEVVEALELRPLLTRQPRNLSGGERQRCALARALLSAPRLLLLDEPLAALDRSARAKVIRALRDLGSRHDLPMLTVSHDEQDLRELADTTLLLESGRLTLS